MTKTKHKPKHHYDPFNKRDKHPLDFLYRIISNLDGSTTDSYILSTLSSMRIFSQTDQKNGEENKNQKGKDLKKYNQIVGHNEYRDFAEIFLYKLFKHHPHQPMLNFTLSLIKMSKEIALQMYFLLMNKKSLNSRSKNSKRFLRAHLLREISQFWGRRSFKALMLNYGEDNQTNESEKVPLKFQNAYPDRTTNNLKKRFQKYLKTRELKNQIDNDLNSISIEPGVDSNKIEGSNQKNKFSIKMKTRFYSIPTKTPQTLQGYLIHLATLPSIFFPSPVALNYRNIFHLIPEKTVKRSINQNFFGAVNNSSRVSSRDI